MFDGYLNGAAGEMSNFLLVDPTDDIPKNCEQPVWILGRRYSADQIEEIRADVQSRLWCTYRRAFVPIGSPQLTSDKGWGCMLRCGQMILAQSLIDMHLGRDWRWKPESMDLNYLKIVNRFEDTRTSSFSLHQIAMMGDAEDKKVGQWFGPNTVAQVLKKLVRFDDWCNLTIHVAMDNVVITQDVIELCQDPSNPLKFKPLLLIVPLRLGIHDINPIYIEGLKKVFELPGCVGMIGGRPNQALYFIGHVGDEALFLDPHTTQNAGIVGRKLTDEEIEVDATFHQKYAQRIDFKQMDPSLAIGFVCKSRTEFDRLCSQLTSDLKREGIQPLFEVSMQRLKPWMSSTSYPAQTERLLNNPLSATSDDFEEIRHSDEDFEIIA